MSKASAAKAVQDERGDVRTEVVNLRMMKHPPEDYHCRCRFCAAGFKGVLVRKDGTPYSRLDRAKYYSPVERVKTGKEDEGGHVAKTPLHVARWAIQSFSKPGDWVMDPTMGAGTTAVEALNHGRNVFGVEIQSIDVIQANVDHALLSPPEGVKEVKYDIQHGDAREMKAHLNGLPRSIQFSLIVNNPPYSGDQRMQTDAKLGENPINPATGRSKKLYTVGYDKRYANLAFLKEGPEYWEIMKSVYAECVTRLRPGGRFVIGVKDQMRNKVADELHRKFAEVLESIEGMRFEGVVALPHHPSTLFMNTYPLWHPEARVPMHQSIVVFRKETA